MIKLTDKEFEQIIEEKIIRDGMAITKISKELKTDTRTFYNRVLTIAESNPDLYMQFVEKCQYKPKEITGISVKNIIIEFIKGDNNFKELAKKYNMGENTLRRKIKKFKNSENEEERELYNLYQSVAYNHSHAKENSEELENMIDKFSKDSEFERYDDREKRKQYLKNIQQEYLSLRLQMSEKEAAKKIGITPNRLYKLRNELYRIEMEDNAIRKKEFKKNLNVKIDNNNINESEKLNEGSNSKVKIKENEKENEKE